MHAQRQDPLPVERRVTVNGWLPPTAAAAETTIAKVRRARRECPVEPTWVVNSFHLRSQSGAEAAVVAVQLRVRPGFEKQLTVAIEDQTAAVHKHDA